MVSLEKITRKSVNDLRILFNKSSLIESYDKNFFEQYDKQNFVFKFLYRKLIYVIKFENKIIGFIWFDSPMNSIINILSLYIDDEYIEKVNRNTLDIFNKYILSYDAINNEKNGVLLNRLGFNKMKSSMLMELDLQFYDRNFDCTKILNNIVNSSKIKSILVTPGNTGKNDSNIKIRMKKFIKGQDEEARCNLQNVIFGNSTRNPINIQDIISDTNQDYFIDDLCYFIQIGSTPIGYGQIVYLKNMYTVVNLGIIKELQNNNLGKILLNQLILSAKKLNITKLYIRVEEDNINAKKLYTWCGFKNKYNISKWDR